MKKYLVEYKNTEGERVKTIWFDALNRSEADSFALAYMGEHHSFDLSHEGKNLSFGFKNVCPATGHPNVIIARSFPDGWTFNAEIAVQLSTNPQL